MKKAVSFILALTMCMMLCACGGSLKSDDNDHKALSGMNSEEDGYTGRGEPQKINAEAAGKYSPDFYVSSDASAVFYFKGLEKTDSGDYYGTLMKYSLKDKESVKISSEVLTDSIFDGRTHDFAYTLDGSSFIYGKYVDSDDSDVVLNWMLFNGKDSEIVAKNLTTADNRGSAAAVPAKEK